MPASAKTDRDQRDLEIMAVTAELEVALQRAKSAERQAQALQEQLETTQAGISAKPGMSELGAEVKDLRDQIAALRSSQELLSRRLSFTQVMLLLLAGLVMALGCIRALIMQ